MCRERSSSRCGSRPTFDIVNTLWGYTAPFSSNQDAQGPQDVEFIKALSDSAANGRAGLGTIMVVSAGNGRQDDVNAQGNGSARPELRQ